MSTTSGMLPPLREDLVLLPAEHDEFGAPNWTIRDPVRNRYFRIGMAAFEMLSRWPAGTVAELVRRVEAETILRISQNHVLELIRFLHANSLIQRSGADSATEFYRIEQAGRPPLWKWLMHHYLFLRIPLWQPDRFLRKTQWLADLVAARRMQQLIVLLGLIGLFLTLRQWDQFITTLRQFANWQGLAWMALTLTSVKILHELGHAYTATRYGCRVPTMGVALLVLYPVLYTDTSDAWGLTSREQKLCIGAAGIRVELCLALLATFLWHLLPPGPLQSTMFLLATTTWISTLLINLSPLMRFDGYYLLADWLRVPNLQQRAFALARWRLREALFGLGMPPPEPTAPRRRRQLILFAYAVWIYRFFLFIGIGLLVYHLFFKALGIVLFAIEILCFIILPVAAEIKVWWRQRNHARITSTAKLLVGMMLSVFALMLIPWRDTVTAPALLQTNRDTAVLSAATGQITQVLVSDGQWVEVGSELMRLNSPELDHERARVSLQLRAAEIQLAQARTGGDQLADAARREQEVLRLQAELKSIKARAARLIVQAPIAGIVRELAVNARPGAWIAAKTPLMRMVGNTGPPRITGYVSQSDIARLSTDASAEFIPEQLTIPAMPVRIENIDQLSSGALECPQLASVNGGPLVSRRDKEGTVRPVDALYRVTGTSHDYPGSMSTLWLPQRGSLKIKAPPVSIAHRLYENVVAVMLRETAF